MKLIILQGLPASGKTTYAKKFVNRSPELNVRVNRDEIRKMLGPYWVPSREDLVTEIEDEMISTFLQMGYNVISDNTNFRGDERFLNIKVDGVSIRNKENIDTDVLFFDTPLEECIKRDKQREDSVGEKVIKRMYNKYLNDNKN